MTIALALVVAFAVCLPHVLSLRQAPPMVAAVIWLSALVLRSLAAVFAALFFVFYLPSTQLFNLATHWCWHAVLPFFATHLGLSGHQVGDVAIVAPAFVLAISLVSVLWALLRATRAVRDLVRRSFVGRGPGGSLIIGGSDVFVAAAGLAHPRVVVSAGALTALDDEELAASLEHERGHIARRHRYLMVLAEVCNAFGRFVPGGRRASAALGLHLERDADAYAIARRHDPLALASAICKAAGAGPFGPAVMALGGGQGVTTRLAALTCDSPHPRSASDHLHRFVAVVLAVLALGLMAALPAVAAAGVDQFASTPTVRHCPD
jgi:hypothetical protein